MLGSLGNWLTWTTTNPKDEWDTWEVWQRSQPTSHYEKSDIYSYYLTVSPQFKVPKFSASVSPKSTYYVYCFGDFAALLVNPSYDLTCVDIANYCLLLLDFYDKCKGISRHITGDPVGISVLREVVKKNSSIPLHAHDFNQYAYDYGIIHAHTVAQYSLSTLLMRMVASYMNTTSSHGNYPAITVARCEKAYKEYAFGDRSRLKFESTPINIPQKIFVEEGRCSSWPRDSATCSRCQICGRVSENLWGAFNSCLDCHMKRICSVCSLPAVVICSDNLPKCKLHQV